MKNDILITHIADIHGVSMAEILGPRIRPDLIAARQAIVVALRNQGLSYPAIGRIMNRDHSSIMNLVRKATLLPIPDNQRNYISPGI
jgi:chromosomal replication initiation ATPase DnaA